MAEVVAGKTLRDTGLQTITSFKRVIAIDNLVGKVRHEEWPRTQFAAEADRFELWAVNLGLFVSGHGSLDYRVRQAESIRDTLLRFLTSLNNSLAEVIEYSTVEGNLPTAENSEDTVVNSIELESSDEDFEDETFQGKDSDFDLLLDSVKDPIDRLYKLSTWIRNPSSRFASSKALRHQQIDTESSVDLMKTFEKFDYDHVSSLVLQYRKSKALEEYPALIPTEYKDKDSPDLEEVWEPIRTVLLHYKTDVSNGTESVLIRRVARANVRRRMQFAYWKKHRDKLTSHSKVVTKVIGVRAQVDPILETQFNTNTRVSEDLGPMAPEHSVTTATRLSVPQSAFRDDQSNVSVSEYAPSLWQPSKEVLAFPSPPKWPRSGKFFECPYCFTLCSTALLAEKAWKAHLMHDLRPYICTYEECKNPDQLYDTRQDWIQHESSSHRRILRCPEHPGQTFSSLKGYQEHLGDKNVDHSEDIPIIHATESTQISPDRSCPICSLSLETSKALQNHIALHLERFALFSLPRSVDEDIDDADEEDSDKANIAFDGSRDEDFGEDFDFTWEEDLDTEPQDTRSERGSEKSDFEEEYSQISLLDAAMAGREAVVQQLLATGTDNIEFTDSNGRTALSWAAGNGHKAVVQQLLVDGKADVESKDNDGWTALLWAARNGHKAVVQQLLATGNADVRSRNRNGQTALLIAASCGHEAVVRMLLERDDVEADSKDKDDRTPLSLAAENGHEAVVRILLEWDDVEADSKDKYGQTPLSWAAENGHEAVVRILLERDDIEADSKNKYGQTPLSWAIENGHEAVVRMLLERDDVEADSKDQDDRTPLSLAAENGHEAVVRMLLERDDVEADSKDMYDRTPLSWAVENGYEAVVRILLERDDVEANSKNEYGQTPLSWAVENGHEDVVRILQSLGSL